MATVAQDDLSLATPESVDISDSLRQAGLAATGVPSYYREVLRILARHYDAPFAKTRIDLNSGSIREVVKHGTSVDEQWDKICTEVLTEVRYRGKSVARLFEATGIHRRFAVLGVIVSGAKLVGGALVLVTPCPSLELAAARLRELQSLMAQAAMVAGVVDKPNATPEVRTSKPTPEVWQGLSRVGKYESIHEFAFALTNGLKSELGMDQVSLGLVKGKYVEVLSVSGCEETKGSNPGIQIIRQAMEETIDAGHEIVYQPTAKVGKDALHSNHALHRKWYLESGHCPVATVPLGNETSCVAVVGLRRSLTQSISTEDVQRALTLVKPLLPGLVLMDRASQSPWRLLLQDCGHRLRQTIAYGRGVAAVIGVATLAWTLLGTATYCIHVPCKIASRQTRQLAAPFAGRIAEAYVVPGQTVRANQPLVTFETTDQQLERQRMMSELQIVELSAARELTEGHHELAAEKAAEADVLRSKIAYMQRQIEHALLVAPYDGVVVSGDPERRVGEVVPLGETLLTLSPTNASEVRLLIPETEASHVRSGHGGRFASSAHPHRSTSFQIDEIAMTSTVEDGKPVYIATAKSEFSKDLRYGMTGFAKIDTDRRPIWWILSHKFLRTIHAQTWK